MTAQNDIIAHAVTSKFLERLKAAPINARPEGLREALIDRLSAAAPVSARILQAMTRAAEGMLVAAAGLLLAIYHPGFGIDAPAELAVVREELAKELERAERALAVQQPGSMVE